MKNSEPILSSFLNHASNIVICTTLDYIITEFNHAAERYYGWKSDNVLGKNYLDLCSQASVLGAITEPSAKIINTGIMSGYKTSITQPDNTESIARWTLTPLLNSREEAFGLLLIGEDITEKESLHNQLLLSQKKEKLALAQLERVLEQLPAAIYWKNKAGQYLGCNQYFLTLLGLDNAESIVGKTDHLLAWKKSAELYREQEFISLRSGKVNESLREITLPNQETLTLMVKNAPLQNNNGELLGTLSIGIDITKRTKLNHSHDNEKKQLKQQLHEKDLFFMAIAHGLRNPLNGLVSSVKQLSKTTPNKEQTQLITDILDTSHLLLTLTDDLFELAKLQSGGIALVQSELNLTTLFTKLTRNLTTHKQKNKIKIKLVIEDSVPKLAYQDSGRIEQIYTTLVSHMIQLAEENSHFIITISQTKLVGRRFTIKINLTTQEDINDANNTHHTPSHSIAAQEAVSFKLSMIRNLVTHLDGTLVLRTLSPRALGFTLALPFFAPLDSTEKKINPAEILFIHDNRLLSPDSMDHPLYALRCTTCLPNEAIEHLRKNQYRDKNYRVIILNKEINGDQDVFMLSSILQAHPQFNTPILLLWGDTISAEEIELTKQAGFHGYISAANTHQEIIAVLADAEKQHQLLEANQLDGLRQKKLTILVVEDDEINQRALQFMLSNLGCQLTFAKTGREAINLNKERNFDLIFMDIGLPYISGLETTKIIRHDEKISGATYTPIVAITGYVSDMQRQNSLAIGFDDLLMKPVNPQIIRAMLAQWFLKPETKKTNTQTKDKVSS